MDRRFNQSYLLRSTSAAPRWQKQAAVRVQQEQNSWERYWFSSCLEEISSQEFALILYNKMQIEELSGAQKHACCSI